ncbi:hypothetical protein [Herbiconiux ginsengi]|uniref:Uncharacterized protein n=1 Tax=Herbiconiux ginsengi TaxID=381665 RepID=A0A1H3TDP5_9MICO|nr:hypothetical protein [Herbiconiux ginsengi]SDZ48220.1 hypothetical protein SAMN05216554_4101 [Herbiconiux ginsengi]
MSIESIDLSGFEGLWVMDLGHSRIRDENTGGWKAEDLEGQTIEMLHHGDVQEYRIRVDIAPDLTTYMGYTCTFGDPEWVPYSVVEIAGDPNHPRLKPNKVLKGGTRLGEPIAWVKQVYVDPRTHYRITKNPDGTAQYAMLRRLSEDGTTLVSTVLSADGTSDVAKHFVRAT